MNDETKMKQLLTLVECQLGFPLFNEIEKAKIRLGVSDSTEFKYQYPGIDISQDVSRAGYEQKVSPSVEDIMASMMEVF